MELVKTVGTEDVAFVHIGRVRKSEWSLVEFVDATDGGRPREEKWVLNISTQFGCPVKCRMCDAGSHYFGDLSEEEMMKQIRFLVKKRFPDGKVVTDKFKIHFSRMGEPLLNGNLPSTLETLAREYPNCNLIPAVATVGPVGSSEMLDRLKTIKDRHFPQGRFQLQFSVNSTDEEYRDWLMPARKMDLTEIAKTGSRFFTPGDRKVVLNLAVGMDTPLDPSVIAHTFHPEKFIVKLTPLNPTATSKKEGMATRVSAEEPEGVNEICKELEESGFDVIISIGSPLEDEIGSNCGEAVLDWRKELKGNFNVR